MAKQNSNKKPSECTHKVDPEVLETLWKHRGIWKWAHCPDCNMVFMSRPK